MATDMLQYLDPDGLNETVLNIGQIKTILEGQISDLEESIEEELQDLPYARPDGLYPDMTVGAVQDAPQTSQWEERESTGSGTAQIESVQGATVVWNQLNQNNRNSTTFNGVTFTNNNDGTWTVSGTATSDARKEVSTVPRATDNKYLVRGCPSGGSASTYSVSVAGGVHDVGGGYIYTSPTYTSTALYIVVMAGTTVNNLIFTPQLFNLTQMFGAGNEPATVEEFERMYPEAYYPYSAPTLKPVQIAGIASTDAQGGELDSVEWETQTLRAAGSVADVLTANELVTRVGVVDLGTLGWAVQAADTHTFHCSQVPKPAGQTNIACAQYEVVSNYAQLQDMQISGRTVNARIYVRNDSCDTVEQITNALAGVLLFYELATPTTTPISPALPMTYRVQQGGTESIIVPDGEVSAIPLLTITDPLNVAAEFARVWEAIGQLQSRSAAQLSRPVSLADAGSVDETQKDTAEIAEIETTKEVQE